MDKRKYTIDQEREFPTIRWFNCGEPCINTYAEYRGQSSQYWDRIDNAMDSEYIFIARDEDGEVIGFAVLVMYYNMSVQEFLRDIQLTIEDHVGLEIHEDRLVGWEEELGYLEIVAVQDHFQGMGVGQALLDRCLAIPMSYAFVRPLTDETFECYWEPKGFTVCITDKFPGRSILAFRKM